MHKPESALENEWHKILGDFDIQTDQKIQVKRLGLVLINKKKIICSLVAFGDSTYHRMKI